MTTMLTRDVIDNRLLRATGQLDTTLGAGMRATFEMPTLTELVGGQFDEFNAFSGLTPEERIAAQAAEATRKQDIKALQDELLLETDAQRKQDIVSQLEELQTGPQDTLDALSQQAVADGRMRSQEDLQQQYGDLGLTFDRAMTDEEAKHIAARKREEITRQSIIEASPKGVLPGAAKFGAGLAAMAVDPLEIATAFIPVVGQAGKAAAVGRLGRVGGRAAVGVAEGCVGNLMTEPLYYGLSRSQQLDYDMSDALLNVGLGAVFGGVLGAGVGVFSRAGVDVPVKTETSAIAILSKEDNALDLFDSALSYAKSAKGKKDAADIALRQFALDQNVKAFDVASLAIAEEEFATIARALDQMKKTPITSYVKDFFKIDPSGKFAAELKSAGVTPRTAPGLYKRGGLRDLDNLVASEADEVVPGLSRAVGRDRTYLDRQGLIDAISQEVSGGDPMAARVDLESQIESGRAYNARIAQLSKMAEESGFIFHSKEEVAIADEVLRAGGDIDDIISRVIRADIDSAPADLAVNASSIEADPLANIDASRRSDVVAPETFAQDTLADMEAAVRGLEEADTLSPAAKAELAEVKDIEIKARSYRAASEAATTCLLGV